MKMFRMIVTALGFEIGALPVLVGIGNDPQGCILIQVFSIDTVAGKFEGEGSQRTTYTVSCS